MRGEPERQVDEPDDAQPEHPEQHPGSDRPGRGLPHEHGAAPGVDPQREEKRDLREHPEDVEDALVPLRLGDEVRAEDVVDVDRVECQAARNRGRIEEERADGECRDDERGEESLQKASPTRGDRQEVVLVGRSLPALAESGALYGYRLVTRSEYAYVCAE